MASDDMVPEEAVEELDAQVEDRGRDLQGMLELDPDTMDPSKKYKFVKDNKLRIARHRMRGYRPVLSKEGGVRPLVEFDDTGDGLIRVGDTILMEAPRKRIEAMQQGHRDLATKRLHSGKRKVKDRGEREGIEVFDDNPKKKRRGG